MAADWVTALRLMPEQRRSCIQFNFRSYRPGTKRFYELVYANWFDGYGVSKIQSGIIVVLEALTKHDMVDFYEGRIILILWRYVRVMLLQLEDFF